MKLKKIDFAEFNQQDDIPAAGAWADAEWKKCREEGYDGLDLQLNIQDLRFSVPLEQVQMYDLEIGPLLAVTRCVKVTIVDGDQSKVLKDLSEWVTV